MSDRPQKRLKITIFRPFFFVMTAFWLLSFETHLPALSPCLFLDALEFYILWPLQVLPAPVLSVLQEAQENAEVTDFLHNLESFLLRYRKAGAPSPLQGIQALNKTGQDRIRHNLTLLQKLRKRPDLSLALIISTLQERLF